jgi:hypothetical protein
MIFIFTESYFQHFPEILSYFFFALNLVLSHFSLSVCVTGL